MERRSVVAATLAAVLTLTCASHSRAAKRAPVTCPPGRYLLATPLLATGLQADAVSVAGTQVAIASGCPAVTAKRLKGRKQFVDVIVVWPACTGLPGKATLKAHIDATCSTMTGTLKVSRVKPRRRPTAFAAGRSRCGDGVLDTAAGEQCEPAGTGACGAGCAWTGASRDDDFSPQAVAVPDFTKITLTAQPSGFTHVAGAAGAIPGPFPVYVASPNSAHQVFTTAAADGSFAADVVAPPAAWVLVKYDPLGGAWIDPASGDVLQAPVNSAPGAWRQVAWTAPAGPGVPFALADSTFSNRVDLQLAGRMTQAAGMVTLTGTLTVYSTASLTGQTPTFSMLLHRLYNAAGQPRVMANQFFSTILTPTGLPVEHWSGPPLAADALQSSALASVGTNVWAAPFTYTTTLPPGLPAGRYAISISTFGVTLDGSLGGARREVNPFLTNHEVYFPPFTVGSPAPAHLVWGLLTDVFSADGSRGTVAAEDVAGFGIADRVATQADSFIVPRVSKKDGQPLVYRLEPYVPMVSEGERRLANVPTHAFAFPSGALTVTITRPDAQVVHLGPEPFRGAHARTPASSHGELLDNGGGHLGDVFQLSTDSGVFDYQFPAYGEYTIAMQGTVDDVYGNTYTGGGTYTVFVAEPLDLEPGVLPMTPLEVGNALAPAVTVLPGVPADVTVQARLLVDSDPAQAVSYTTHGTANRYGTFAAPVGATPMIMTGPGELTVTTVAKYTDPGGVLWMGATRWGQVVAPVNSSLVAHGRHEVDDVPVGAARQSFVTNIFPSDAHAYLPWATGDILWQGESEAARVQITAEDTNGAVQAAMADWVAQGNYFSQGDYVQPVPTFAARAAKGELPFGFSTSTAVNPAEEPADIVSSGYWYGAVERPGERVREMISVDDNGTGYWRYGELYGLQPGMGSAGDLPGDFKFMFGGAVFRDTVHAVRAYGIYGSLWVHLPAGDPSDRTTAVFPPFDNSVWANPILTLGQQAIAAFVVPLAARPGTILEVGDTFSFAAQLAPTLPASVAVTVTDPGGADHGIAGRANAVGYFHDPAQDFVVGTPGVHHVAVTATFDGSTSAGPLAPPYPTGTVLGAVAGGFDVYVVAKDTPPMPAGHPPWSVIVGAGPVALTVQGPYGVQTGTVHYTIAMPGHLLTSGTTALAAGTATITYDPATLAQTFQNLDTDGRFAPGPGLADTVWVNLALDGADGRVYAEQLTLQGPDLLLPPR